MHEKTVERLLKYLQTTGEATPCFYGVVIEGNHGLKTVFKIYAKNREIRRKDANYFSNRF